MKTATGLHLILVTAPNLTVARRLARAAIEQRLVACANIMPRIESVYWWQGKIESGREALLVLKSRKPHLGRLEKLIASLHPYDTPEFVVLNPSAGSNRYLDWWAQETT